MLAPGPKRKKADELDAPGRTLQPSLTRPRAQPASAAAARREFPPDYQQLVVLGKAVPGGDETSSLLVELNQIADELEGHLREHRARGSKAKRRPGRTAEPDDAGSRQRADTGTSGRAGPSTSRRPRSAASLLPIGRPSAPPGLGVMPYDLTFNGSFFDVADFIQGIDSLVHTGQLERAVDGRLVTLDGFVLTGDRRTAASPTRRELLGHHLPGPARPGRHRRGHARPRPAAARRPRQPGDRGASAAMNRLKKGPEIKLPKVRSEGPDSSSTSTTTCASATCCRWSPCSRSRSSPCRSRSAIRL